MKLSNKTVVVFGGATGIGYATAEACIQEGAIVYIASRSKTNLETAQSLLSKKYNLPVHIKVCDVTEKDDIVSLYKDIESDGNDIYGIVFSSGLIGPLGPIEETDLDKWINCVNVNLLGAARCLHLAIGKMKERRQGRIILMSGGGQGPLKSFSSYVSSKGGIWRLTETLAAELSPFNVYINAIAPGAVNTQILDEVLSAGSEKLGSEHYNQRIKQLKNGGIGPEKAANCAIYLLSRKSEGLTGKMLSAVWDPYETFLNTEQLSKSDKFTMKRVIDDNGGTRFNQG